MRKDYDKSHISSCYGKTIEKLSYIVDQSSNCLFICLFED